MTDPIKLGNEKQLFIDDYCVGELRGVKRRFHQAKKHPANPIMTPQDWQADIQIYGNVIYDPQMNLYRMWYNACYEPGGTKDFAICHATSPDGIHWEQTQWNRIENHGKVLTNALLTGYLRGPTVFLTPDDPDLSRRYRMFVHTGDNIFGDPDRKPPFTAGYSVLFSPDGFVWTPYENNPVMQGGDIATCMYDPMTKDYIAFPKIHDMSIREASPANANDKITPPLVHEALARWNRRCVGVSASRDFVTWGTPEMHLSADMVDDARVAARLERFKDLIVYDDPAFYSADMQGMTGFRYEGLRLGLIWFYDRSSARPMAFGGNDDGILNIQLAYTRDPDPYGYWQRVGDRYDFISCGALGECDCGMIFAANTVVEREDELLFYYTGYNHSHGYWGGKESGDKAWEIKEPSEPLTKNLGIPSGSVNLATLRRDGFASIDALCPGGGMTTKLLTFEGDRLLINADAEKGVIQVELTDHESKPIPGYTKEESVPFSSNGVCEEIRWKSGKSVDLLAGKPVHVVFHIKTARLYSFKFCS